ncbi:hypothetical protein GA0070562_2103 [Micromonospora tulbaghiae]|uniref:Chlorite dismutase n=1 Tax=Micromonospora tulbaghiae TaxID=479978 RepID=A0ABY0KHE9_9ACTN|nr:hypothetical protein GA0070562_2103 [Micromonospora tulbaghiae]
MPVTITSRPTSAKSDPWSFLLPAQHQTTTAPDEILHSGNAGLIIHRVGQVAYEFRDEAREFARSLQQHNNQVLHPYATAFVYEEVFGRQERLHWLIHMRAPNDYGRLLEMVEHDSDFKEIAQGDRLTDRGGGNWERMFGEATFQETVIVPQHGLTHADEDDDLDGLFAAPAHHQTDQPADRMLHSANACAIVHRRAQVKYEMRKEGRQFAYEWQEHINRALAGEATIFLYEETWGRQDRIHWLIHLRTLDAYRHLMRLAETDDDFRALLDKQFVAPHKGGGTWGRMFVEGSINDTVLVPHTARTGR